ncbi:thiamine pyrophosphokinase 2 isoform 2-T3 [Menidia menidia]
MAAMSSCGWTDRVLRLLHRMNNFSPAGSGCLRFLVGGAQVGWIPPRVADLLRAHPHVFLPPQGGAVVLSPRLDSYHSRSQAVDAVLRGLRGQETPPSCLRGWRDERYSVSPRFCDPPLMWMERAATSLFGVRRYGVHLNGFVVETGGAVSMWLSRRAPSKQTYPGLLDNLQTLLKESEEEACIPPELVGGARPVGTVSYSYEDDGGVFSECQFVFDLQLPADFRPAVGDGEVQQFYLLPLAQVKELLASDDFKPNSAMVVLDFLIRHSLIHPDQEPYYQEFVAGLHHGL